MSSAVRTSELEPADLPGPKSAERQPPENKYPERQLHLGWFDWLTRHRPKIYAVLALLYLASFNGFWRVGVDSALYRGLARSLARGQGYVFAGEQHHHAYPGLPWMLAVLDKVFGESAVPGLVMMTVMALVTLWLVDRTIALRYPLWVATVVTVGMALNVRFLRQSQQLMTDVPFTLGVVASLYALERLRLLAVNAKWSDFIKWAAMLFAALGLAAATRPTFGVLAGALVVGSAFRAVHGKEGRRWLHASIVVAALLVLFALFLVDPRTVGIRPMEGVYEQELVERVKDLPLFWLDRARALMGRDLNDAFFAQQISPAAYGASALVLVAAAFMLRRDVVWGLMIFGIVAVTFPLSSVPRYYLMVMPLMFVGWTILWCHVTLKIPLAWQGPVLGLALGFPMMVNGGRCVGFILEQRRPDFRWLLHGEDRTKAFYTAYRDGIVFKQQRMAKMIADHATRTQTVVGPDAHVLAYFSDRRVIGERTLFIDRELALPKLPKLLAEAKPAMAIFPGNAYAENDSLMREMIRRKILVATNELAKDKDVQLAEVEVRLPAPGERWNAPRPPTTTPTTHRAPTTRKYSSTQKAEKHSKQKRLTEREIKNKRAERQAKIDRQSKKDRRSTTQPQTQAQLDRAAKRERELRRERIERREKQNSPATTRSTAQPAR